MRKDFLLEFADNAFKIKLVSTLRPASQLEARFMQRFAIGSVIAATLAGHADAQQAPTLDRGPVLSVRGEGKVEVKPEFAEFWATVSVTKPTMEAATAALPEKATRALTLLKSLSSEGLEIRRSNYSLHENRPFSSQTLLPGTKLPDPSYVASTQYQLRVHYLDALSAVYSKLNDASVFEIYSQVSFEVEDQRNPLNLARKAAYADALAQGQAYAEAAKLNLAQILQITDGDARPEDGQADLARATSGTNTIAIIPPATLTYTATVNVSWKITPHN